MGAHGQFHPSPRLHWLDLGSFLCLWTVPGLTFLVQLLNMLGLSPQMLKGAAQST